MSASVSKMSMNGPDVDTGAEVTSGSLQLSTPSSSWAEGLQVDVGDDGSVEYAFEGSDLGQISRTNQKRDYKKTLKIYNIYFIIFFSTYSFFVYLFGL